MTDVSDQTQPVDRLQGSTIQGNANTTSSVPSAIKSVYSNAISIRDTVIETLEDKGLSAFAAVVGAFTGAPSAFTVANRRLVSPGQFSVGSTDYSNRPKIFVVKNKTNGATSAAEEPVGEFSDWFLNSVQEQDMERTDVVETFGAPHIFVSGRFTRKIVFSGMVRTTQFNAEAKRPIDRVPQHVLLRNFYERYLRATAQATMDYFTRITVDGDIYEGYITNLVLPRDASVEMVMPFALTMLCIRRYNVNDADAVASLSRFKGPKKSTLPPAFAAASLTDANAGFSLSLLSGGTESKTGVSTNVGKTKEDGSFGGVAPTVQIKASYSGQVVSLSGDGVGIWALRYKEDHTPVSGTVSREGARDLELILVSYSKLVENAKSGNGVSSVSIQFSAAGKAGPILQVVAVASDLPTVKLKSLVLTLGSGEKFNAVINGTSIKVIAADARKAAVLVSAGQWSIPFSLLAEYTTPDGQPLPAGAIPSPPAESALIAATGFPAQTTRAGQNNMVEYDTSIARPGFSAASLVSSPAAGTVEYAGLKYVFSTTTTMTGYSPFAVADAVETSIRLNTAIPAYAPSVHSVTVTLAMGKPTLVTSLFTSLLTKRLDVRAVGTSDSATGTQATYRAFFSVFKAERVIEPGISSDVYDAFLASATLSLQYDQGALVSRISKSTSTAGGGGSLNLPNGITQIPLSVSANATFDNRVEFTLTFSPSASIPGPLLSAILSNPVAGSITFPPIYQLEAIPLNFTK